MKNLRKNQRLQLSLSTNEFPKDFSLRTTKVNCLIHHLVVLLINHWLNSMDQIVNSLTSFWHPHQQLKVVFYLHISSCQKMILVSQRPKFNILHLLCAISISIGQDQLKFQHPVNMLTKLQSSLWILVLTRREQLKLRDVLKKHWWSNKRLSSLLHLLTTDFISFE